MSADIPCPIHEDSLAEFVCTDPTCEASHDMFCTQCQHTNHLGHQHKWLQQIVNDNIDNLQAYIKEAESTEAYVKRQLHQADLSIKSFDANYIGMITARRKIERNIERKHRRALKSFESWATGKKMKLAADRMECKQNLKHFQNMKRKVRQTLMRKTELHGDLADFKGIKQDLASFMARERNYFSLDEYNIDTTFETSPKPPNVLGNTPAPNPTNSFDALLRAIRNDDVEVDWSSYNFGGFENEKNGGAMKDKKGKAEDKAEHGEEKEADGEAED